MKHGKYFKQECWILAGVWCLLIPALLLCIILGLYCLLPVSDPEIESALSSLPDVSSAEPAVSSSPSRPEATPTPAPSPTPAASVLPVPEPEPPSPEPTVQPEPSVQPQPEELERLLLEAGYTWDTLAYTGQLVVVRGTGGSAEVYTFERTGEQWALMNGPVNGFVGRDGVGNASEYTAHTPQGLFTLEFAFGNAPDPGTAMEYRQVTESIYWVDDPASQHYNRWIDAAQIENRDWSSAEHLSAISVYEYALAIGYNLSCTPGSGSAFFMHCSDGRPTAGCVAVDTAVMIELLQWLRPEQSPCILMYAAP